MESRTFRKVLITGITGSGGSYLAEHIIAKHQEVEVHGISRWHSTVHNENLKDIKDKVYVHECDLLDLSSIMRVLKVVKPDAIFHLASHANVRASFDTPISVIHNNVMGTVNLFEAVRALEIDPFILLCSTSEVYGKVDPKNVPIKEDCPLNAANPYSVSKVTQDLLGQCYFLTYQMKIIRTRMFAYINPKRSDLFATSFAMQVARIEHGLQDVLYHGNLDSVRTLIDVRDAMEAYWLALNKGLPGEVYNIGGKNVLSVNEFLEQLKGLAKVPIRTKLDPALLRPVDVTLQIPDTSKFEAATGWRPKYTLNESLTFLLEYCRSIVRRSQK